MAPKQNEPPFLVAQVIPLVAIIALGTLSLKRFREQPATLQGVS